ncbi:MAG: hypothetical protein U9R75_04435 [Candidatus Thermoplasmatota archaeon]|nr:hypothetical protein [Candidatus Thermoplasmatota archaeon]
MEYEVMISTEMRKQLSFLFNVKENMKDLDERIRTTSLFLARMDLMERHKDIEEWEVVARPDESMVKGIRGERTIVISKVRTMSLHGKSALGGRQHESMKKNLERVSKEKADFKYFFLLDPWTVEIVKENFNTPDVSVLPLLKDNISSVVRTPEGDEGSFSLGEMSTRMVEEVITDEEFPDDRTIVTPISRTSIRQGFLYIPKERGHLLEEGPITIFIRKDASLTSKCMISQTGGVRIGGGLTKWFRSLGLKPDDELIMGHLDDNSLLVLMVRRSQPYRG